MLIHNLKNKISNLLRKSMKGGMRGFTLLELVIVIAIIGILAVIVLPSMLSALAKARDAKKMTEIRGIQTFLTVNGIDTSLRYPASAADLISAYGGLTSRQPPLLTSAQIAASDYIYAPIDCDSAQQIKVGTWTSTAGSCSSYQLSAELERWNPALDLDSDLIAGNAAASVAGNNPKVSIGKLTGDVTTAITSPMRTGSSEACTSNTTVDCIFDLVP